VSYVLLSIGLLATAYPLDQIVSFKASGDKAEEVIAVLTKKTGTEVGYFRDSATVLARLQPVYLSLPEVKGWDALDWVSRAAGLAYTPAEDGSVWFGRNAVLDRSQVLQAYAFGTYFQVKKMVVGQLNYNRECELLMELIQRCLKGLRVETATVSRIRPTVDSVKGSLCTVRAPAWVHPILRQVIDQLSLDTKAGWTDEVRKWEAGIDTLRAALSGAEKYSLADHTVWSLAAKVSEATRINIGVESEVATVKLASGEAGSPLKALEKAAELSGAKLLFEPRRGVWVRSVRKSDVLPWSYAHTGIRLLVRSYYVGEIISSFGKQGGAALEEQLRQEVSPGTRLFVAAYHLPSGRIVVVTDPELQFRAALCLKRLAGD